MANVVQSSIVIDIILLIIHDFDIKGLYQWAGWLVSKTSRQNVLEVWSLNKKRKRCHWQREVSLPSERLFNYFKMAAPSQMATSELYCWEGDWDLPSVDTECLIVLVRYQL